MSIEKHILSTIMASVEGDSRTAIIRLNQSLIDLRTELYEKLTAFEASHEAVSSAEKMKISRLAEEVERALESLEELVDATVAEATG